jgi:hypothetical protein
MGSEFEKSLRTTAAMYGLTRSHIVNTYWQFREELEGVGFAPFVVRGSLCWESEELKRTYTSEGDLWLMSNFFNPVGHHIGENPVRQHMQYQLTQYEIWGGLALPPMLGDEAEGKEVLREVVECASLATALASLATGASLSWFPARYLNVRVASAAPPSVDGERSEWRCLALARGAEDHSFARVTDEFVSGSLFPLYEQDPSRISWKLVDGVTSC